MTQGERLTHVQAAALRYLVWFDDKQEYILRVRSGRPAVRSGRPGLALEALQHATDQEPGADWTGEDLALSMPASAPAWFREVTHTFPGELGPQGIPILQSRMSAMLGGPGGPRPRDRTMHFSAAIRRLQRTGPRERYHRLMALTFDQDLPLPEIEQAEMRLPDFPTTGLELWDVLEHADEYEHRFPQEVLQAAFPDLRVQGPLHCFGASSVSTVAVLEIAWAIEHNVWARQCAHPHCGVWFLQTGPQGGRREFCQRHKGVGAVMRKHAKYQKEFPAYWTLRNRLRSVSTSWKRGTLPEAQYRQAMREIHRRIRHLADQGRAPRRAGKLEWLGD